MAPKIIFIVTCFGFCINGFAQNFKKSKNLLPLSDSVVAMYFIPQSDEVMRLTSIATKEGIEKGGPYKGFEITSISQALVFADGIKISLLKDETLVDFKKNNLVTVQPDIDNNNKMVVRSYHLINKKLELIGKTISNLDNQVFLLNDGLILLTDEYELYGRTVYFYDPSLKLVSKSMPFGEEGFNTALFSEDENQIAFLFKPIEANGGGNMTLIIYSKKTGEVLQKHETSIKDIKISKIKFSDKDIIICGDRKIIVINNEGKTKWFKTINWYPTDMTLINNDKNLVIVTNVDITILSTKDGEQLWSYSFSDLPIIKDRNESSYIIQPLEIKAVIDNSRICLLLGLYDKNDADSIHPAFNSLFILFDHQGLVLEQELAPTKSHFAKINVDDDKIFILNENNIFSNDEN